MAQSAGQARTWRAPRQVAEMLFLDLGAMPAATQGDGSLSRRLELPGGITLTIAGS